MTTSPKESWKLASCLEDEKLDPVTLGYFQGLAQNEAHETVLELFLKMAVSDKLTRAFIARRLGKSPEQITRWLSAPGNWTLDTLTNLLLAMGHRPKFAVERLSEMRQSNQHHPAVQKAIRHNIDDSLKNFRVARTNYLPNPNTDGPRISIHFANSAAQ